MRELDHILEAWRRMDCTSGAVLATVVHVEGSAYRRPGARMLIGADGRRIGTISGGCLEGDVSKKAAWWTSGGRPALKVYDTTSEDDAVWEFGLGCNGVITVLLEPADSKPVEAMFQYLSTRPSVGSVVATVIRAGSGTTDPGERWLGKCPLPSVAPHMREAEARRQSRLVHLEEMDVFVEWIGPRQRLIVLGAGHDARPLTKIANVLGWAVTVADGRPAYARRECFPEVEEVQLIGPAGDLTSLGLDGESAVVMMTHNYPMDRKLLPQVLAANPRYLGMLGPRKRAVRLFGELGIDPADWNIHAPVGLDIGSDDPETVALSIVSEIQAALTGRNGGFLRHREGAIHEGAVEFGAHAAVVGEATSISACEAHGRHPHE